MATLTERVKALAGKIRELEQRPVAIVGGVDNAEINNAFATRIAPFRNRLEAMENQLPLVRDLGQLLRQYLAAGRDGPCCRL